MLVLWKEQLLYGHHINCILDNYLIQQLNTSYAAFSSGIPWNIPRVTCIFAVYTRAIRRVWIRRKYKWQVGYSMVYHEKVLRNYLILPCTENALTKVCRGKKIAVHDGKVELNTVEYTTAVLYFNWLYFLWLGINIAYHICPIVVICADR